MYKQMCMIDMSKNYTFNFYRIIEVNILQVFAKFCLLSQKFKDFCLKKFKRFIN